MRELIWMHNEHIRSVTLELSQANMSDFDTRQFVESLIKGNFNTIVCFAVGYLNGEAYFNSKYIKKNDDIKDRDILGEISDLKKEYNFSFIAYLNTQFSDIYKKNSSWAQRRVDKKKTTQLDAAAICLNSPYNEILLNSAKEISKNYSVDGFYFDEVSFQSWCKCNFCISKYKRDSGANIPNKINFHNKNFLNWMTWRETQVNELMKKFYIQLKRINKKHIIFFQSAFPISSTFTKMKSFQYINPVGNRVPQVFDGFYRPSFYAQNIEMNYRYNDIISIEPWRKIVGAPIWWPGACTSYVRNLDTKKNVLPLMELPHFPWSLLNLNKDEIVFNIADVQANGGGTWYPMYSPDKKNLKFWTSFKILFEKFNEIPKFNNQIFDIGVIFSKNNAEKTNNNDNEDNYIDDFNNGLKLIKELKFTYSILSFESIYNLKYQPKIIVLINHEYFTRKEYNYFKKFLTKGGKILSWGKTPKFLDSGKEIQKSELFKKNIYGVKELKQRPFFGYLYYSDTNILSPTYGLNIFYKKTTSSYKGYIFEGESMFATPDEDNQIPAIFHNKKEKGEAILFSNNQSLIWSKTRSQSTINIFRDILNNWLNKDEIFYSESIGNFSLYIWKKNNKFLVWVINYTNIEENGICNSLNNVKINIPRSLKKIKYVKNFGSSKIAIDNFKRKINVKNMNVWECIEVEQA